MNNIEMEISIFMKIIKVSDTTKELYLKHLLHFVSYLEQKTGHHRRQIYLNQFYVQTDINGKTIRYLPIDSEFIDQYFISHLDKKYYWLKSTKYALNRFFNHLHKVYDLSNPMKSLEFQIQSYKHHSPRARKSFTRHDILKFIHTLVSHSTNLKRDLLFFSLFMSTGCRPNEIISLTVQQLQFENDMLFLPKTKTKQQRYVVLRKGMGVLLKTYCEEENLHQTSYLFPNKNGGLLTINEINLLLKHYLHLANMEPRTLYSFRHSFATIMYESDADITTIQQLLGHAVINTTKNYIKSHYVRNYNVKIQENEELYKKIKDRLYNELLD